MPLSAQLNAYLQDPAFWPRFFFAEEAYQSLAEDDLWRSCEELLAEFPVGGGHVVKLETDLRRGSFELGLLPPGSEKPLSLGWDDQAQWHPHVFRWEELDLLCRAAALIDPRLRHPGPALALLWRFAVIGDHDNLDQITPLLDAAFTTLRPNSLAAHTRWPSASSQFWTQDLRDAGVVWFCDERGNWSVAQHQDRFYRRSLYSRRWPIEPPDEEKYFPFTAFHAMLDQARQTLAAVSTVDDWSANPVVAEAIEHIHADRDLTYTLELGRALAAAGYDHPVVLRGLIDPVHPAEACWLLELITSAPQGSLITTFLEPITQLDLNPTE